MRWLLAPVTRGATWRRAVHLLLGAVLLLPYAALATVFVAYSGSGGDAVTYWLLVVLATAAGAGAALVPGVRALEVTAARALLDVELPDPPAVDTWPARRRAAGWLAVNMVAGFLTVALLFVAVPTALTFLLAPWRAVPPLPTGLAAAWAPPLAPLVVLGVLHVVSAGGAALARLAPRMLGPSPRERLERELADARAEGAAQAHRARVARELHDSVGHALTVTTVQAGAAARVLDTDPAFVARALEAIAEAGRAALTDLDHALGVLRDGADAPRDAVPDLRDLDALVDRTGAAVRRTGEVRALPVVVSREAYRIVQEALTNAVRHGGGRAEVAVRAGADAVEVEVRNPLSGARARPGGGRGVAGMRERVAVLGGELRAGAEDGTWLVRARIPVAPGGAP